MGFWYHEIEMASVNTQLCTALLTGQGVSAALEPLTNVPQLAWPLIFRMACLTTAPRDLHSVLTFMFSANSDGQLTDAALLSTHMTARSLRAYERYTLASLDPALTDVPRAMWPFWNVVGFSQARSCSWSVEMAARYFYSALVSRASAQATQAAFCIVAASRKYAAKIHRHELSDAKGTNFALQIHYAFSDDSQRTLNNHRSVRVQQRGKHRAETIIYIVLAVVAQAMGRMDVVDLCRQCFETTSTNNFYSPYAMSAALITLLLDDATAPDYSCDSSVEFSGLVQPTSDTSDPDDVVLAERCYSLSTQCTMWNMIEAAQFGVQANYRLFGCRIANTESLWSQAFR